MAPYTVTRRDQLAYWLASQVMKLATPEYQAFCNKAWRLGLERLYHGTTEADAGRVDPAG